MHLYTERQKFNQWWVWLILLLVSFIGIGFSGYNGYVHGFTNGVIFSMTIMVIPLVLFFFMTLETKINETGIEVRFFPFHLSYVKIPWTEINTIEVRQYSPLSEYGGWGIKWGSKSGKAYNVSGNKGIQLVLNDGSKLLIGTNKEEEVGTVLKSLGR